MILFYVFGLRCLNQWKISIFLSTLSTFFLELFYMFKKWIRGFGFAGFESKIFLNDSNHDSNPKNYYDSWIRIRIQKITMIRGFGFESKFNGFVPNPGLFLLCTVLPDIQIYQCKYRFSALRKNVQIFVRILGKIRIFRGKRIFFFGGGGGGYGFSREKYEFLTFFSENSQFLSKIGWISRIFNKKIVYIFWVFFLVFVQKSS